MTVAQAVRTPQFVTLVLTNFACCATHSGPIFHTVGYAISCGVAPIAGGLDLQRRGSGGIVRAHRVRAGRRPVRRQARAGGGAARAGVRRAGLWLRARSRRVLCRRRPVRLHLRRGHAALCGAGARQFSAADDGAGDRQFRHGRQPRHGAGADARGLDLRRLRHLLLALRRLVRPSASARRRSRRPSARSRPRGRRPPRWRRRSERRLSSAFCAGTGCRAKTPGSRLRTAAPPRPPCRSSRP